MSGISLDGSCLKISSITNPQPGVQARHPGQGWTVIATIGIAYLVFVLSVFSVVSSMGVCGPDCPDCISSRASHQPASGYVGLGLRTYSASTCKQSSILHADWTDPASAAGGTPRAAKSDRR